tara:strand:+ start:397 stop:600 length:204 start_codon:yes stop_codon:yes gene_type:complete
MPGRTKVDKIAGGLAKDAENRRKYGTSDMDTPDLLGDGKTMRQLKSVVTSGISTPPDINRNLILVGD